MNEKRAETRNILLTWFLGCGRTLDMDAALDTEHKESRHTSLARHPLSERIAPQVVKRNGSYFAPGRSVALYRVELLYVAVINGVEVDTDAEFIAELDRRRMTVWGVIGHPSAIAEFCGGPSEYRDELLRQLAESLTDGEMADMPEVVSIAEPILECQDARHLRR